MDRLEIKDTLDSFSIIVDTREQTTSRSVERFESFGVPYRRATLRYGDYCGNAVLPDGRQVHDVSVTIKAPCVIERKMSLDELAGCFTRGRDRFQREFNRASEAGARVFLLIENGSWGAIQNHRYKSRFAPAAFMASLTAWTIRYNLTPLFCRSGMSGKLIKEILYRDMKERLERGEYG